MMLPTRRVRMSSSRPRSSASDSRDRTRAARSLACATRAALSSPLAAATCLPNDFCSARTRSNSPREERRASSAARIASTIPGSSPRAFCEARTMSGSSRTSLMSITRSGYREPMADLPPLFAEDHTCERCGLAYPSLDVDTCLGLVAESTATLARLLPGLAEATLRQRPAPDVWSVVEYACHVRDVLLTF